MKKRYIIGNWKANKTIAETQAWLEEVSSLSRDDEKEVIVCPPFTLLSQIKNFRDTHELPFYLGVQNTSQFPPGAYTGEVPAILAKEFADFAILGHSERREQYGETDELLVEKVRLAREVGFTIIFCVQGADTPVPDGVTIVAYEPVFAIGSGNPDTPENAQQVAAALKERTGAVILYGGSVKPENIQTFTSQDAIDGVLVGGASLAADSFLSLVKNA